MEKLLIAKLAVENVKYDFDILYSYIVPNNYCDIIKVGSKVLIPFGKNNTIRRGIVFELKFDSISDGKNCLKSIFNVSEDTFLNVRHIEFITWMKSMYSDNVSN